MIIGIYTKFKLHKPNLSGYKNMAGYYFMLIIFKSMISYQSFSKLSFL